MLSRGILAPHRREGRMKPLPQSLTLQCAEVRGIPALRNG
jgi:hypothetical protein